MELRQTIPLQQFLKNKYKKVIKDPYLDFQDISIEQGDALMKQIIDFPCTYFTIFRPQLLAFLAD